MEAGWSARRIAQELGHDRETASKYVRLERGKTRHPGPPGKGSCCVPERAMRRQNPPTRPPGAEPKSATPSADGKKEW